jgi:hypothetical protein
MKEDFVQDMILLLKKDFEISREKEAFSKDELIELLLPIIQQMLNRDFEKLLQICYRVDLGENKLKQILHESDPEMMAFDLAKALVERQMLKIEIKRRYSGS